MVLDVLIDLIWMFGVFWLTGWIMKISNYDLKELVKLVIQISELMESFWELMLSEMFNFQ